MSIARYPFALLALASASSAYAHLMFAPEALGNGFFGGFRHPYTGLDHFVTMLAVGVWSAQLRGAALWVLPIAFPLVLAIGAVLGFIGVALPSVELGIACSAIVLGALVAWGVRLPLAIAAPVVAAFALVHGHAHAVELPVGASPLLFSVGIVLGTASLHLAGMLLAWTLWRENYAFIVRTLGAAIVSVGVVVFVNALPAVAA